ncbi:hypothetical protein GCM10025762_07270 [Haloechinothrix salitolerans]
MSCRVIKTCARAAALASPNRLERAGLVITNGYPQEPGNRVIGERNHAATSTGVPGAA